MEIKQYNNCMINVIRIIFFMVITIILCDKSLGLPAVKNLKRYPIVLMHGDFGTQVEAKLNKSTVPHYVCSKETPDYYILWLSLEDMAPLFLGCWVDNIKLLWNATSNTTYNQVGVSTRLPGWGDTAGVEYLSYPFVSYFGPIINNAISWGYTKGVDILAAQYDFRKAPNEHVEYFIKLKELIEQTYYNNSNTKIVFVAHSMGNNFGLYFLNQQKSSWKSKFIQSFISIGAPWGGSAKTMKLFATGENLDLYRILVNPFVIREAQRTFPSSAFLMPSDKVWQANETLVVTDERNYTVNDYQQFFRDINYTQGLVMHDLTKGLLDLEPPNVEMHCLFGTGLKTADTYVYKGKNSFPNTIPIDVWGDGDGTVNLKSAKVCVRWKGKQKQKVYVKEIPNVEHLELLRDVDVIAYIKNVVIAS